MDNEKAIFYSVIDFFRNREYIKEQYVKMNDKEKRVYKLFVYSLCFENDYTKDCIWEYLNSGKDEEILFLVPLSREYGRRIKCNK